MDINRIEKNMGKLLFGKHASANYNHVRKMAKQIRDYYDKPTKKDENQE